MDTSLKRIMAYIIDVLILTIVFSVFINFKIFNPYIDKYNDTYTEYTNLIEDANAGEIETDTDEYANKIIDLNYRLNRYKVVSSSISTAGFLIYFGILQFFLKGQTIGKKIMKIKVIANKENKKLNIGNYIIRSLILNNIIINLVFIIGAYIFDKSTYYYVSLAATYIQIVIMAAIILMVMLRKDNRGLHDMLAGTKVIDLAIDDVDENKEEIVVVEKKQIKKTDNSVKKGQRKHLNRK